jgi:hypothetical protein
MNILPSLWRFVTEMLIPLRRYDYAAWNSAVHQSQNLSKIIEWQKKAFMLDLQIKGGDHEDTHKARKRLEELTRQNIAKMKELQR